MRLDPEHSGAQAHLDDGGNCQCVGACCLEPLTHRGDRENDRWCVCPDCGGDCAPLPDDRRSWIRRFHRGDRS